MALRPPPRLRRITPYHPPNPAPTAGFCLSAGGRNTASARLSAGYFLGQSQSRAPTPAKRDYVIVSSRLRRRKPFRKHNLYGSPPWRSFCTAKRNQKRVKGDRFPLDKPLSGALLRWIRKAFFLRKKPSVLHADGLNKVSVTHLPPPNLPRFGGGERPPFSCKPIAPLTITMGQRLTVFASPTIPQAPNCRPDFIRPSEPLSRHRERGWGERADAPAATLGAILCAVRIDFGLPSKINPYPAQPATGVLGQRPKRILPTFVRTKVGPRRVGVLTMISKRPAPPTGARKLFHAPAEGICKTHPRRVGVLIKSFIRLASPEVITNSPPPGRRADYDI